ncbi:MAG: hypothetical protein J5972_04230 [Eubacterium sp.]|nr:hypothetical protein [Eubacterium sp.]
MKKIIQSEYVIEKGLWQGEYLCEQCGKKQGHHLYKIRNQRSLRGKPIFATTQKYLSGCDVCKSVREIDKDKYTHLFQCQRASYETGAFPKEIILEDFTPENIHIQKHMVRVIMASIYALIMTGGTVNLWFQLDMVFNAIFYIPAMIFLALGWIPFAIIFLKYLPVRRKYKLYLEAGGTPLGEKTEEDEI